MPISTVVPLLQPCLVRANVKNCATRTIKIYSLRRIVSASGEPSWCIEHFMLERGEHRQIDEMALNVVPDTDTLLKNVSTLNTIPPKVEKFIHLLLIKEFGKINFSTDSSTTH